VVTRSRTVVGRDGRAKAFRPLPAEQREQALQAGIAAYERGDFFEAHEHLEPAWMGTDDQAERSLHQGLIKLAAAYVHAVRGNPRGVARNLVGARARLAEADLDGRHTAGLDLPVLIRDVDARLARLEADPDDHRIDPPDLHRSAT
jgi:hypothetical protein